MKQIKTSGSPSPGYRAPLYCLLLLLSTNVLRSNAQTGAMAGAAGRVTTNAPTGATTGNPAAATADKSATRALRNTDKHKAYPENLIIQIDIALANATYGNTGPITYKSYSIADHVSNPIGGSPEIQDGLMTFTQAGK